MTSAFESSFTLRAKAEGFAALESSIRRIAKAMIQAQQSSGGGTAIARNQQMAQKQAQQMFQGAYADPRLAGAKQDKAGKWRTAKGQFLPKDLQAIAQQGTGLEGVGFRELQQVQQQMGPVEEGGMGMGGAGKFVAREVRTQQQTQMKAENAQAKENVAIVEKENQARATLNTTVGRRIESGKQMLVLDKALGDQSRISTADVAKLRFSINRLKSSQDFQKYATQSQIEGLRALEVQLKKLQAQQYNNASSFTFMAGVGQQAKNAVKQVGAASQGMMLAMSAANGDVMGLAFSLIFLQFAANLPVALGFAAIGVAGVMAFKTIKKIIERRKEISAFGKSFHIATGNIQGYALMQQRATDVLDRFGLSEQDNEEATRALMSTSIDLMRKGIEPTGQALDVVAKAFIVARGYGKEYEEAIKLAQEAGTSFAEKGIISMGAYNMTLDKLDQDAATAMTSQSNSYGALGDTVNEVLENAGIAKEEWQYKDAEANQMALDDLQSKAMKYPETYGQMLTDLQELLDDKQKEFKEDGSLQETYYKLIKGYDSEYVESFTGTTKSILGETDKIIKSMQEEAKTKAEITQTMIDEEKRLLDYYSEARATKQEYLDLTKRSFEVMKTLDQEYITGVYAGDIEGFGGGSKSLVDLPNFETTYLSSEIMKQLDRIFSGETGIEITINDQTSRGTMIETVQRNSGHLVIGNVGMSGEGGG